MSTGTRWDLSECRCVCFSIQDWYSRSREPRGYGLWSPDHRLWSREYQVNHRTRSHRDTRTRVRVTHHSSITDRPYTSDGMYCCCARVYLVELCYRVHCSSVSYQQDTMDINQYLNPAIIASLQAWWYFLMFVLMIVEWPLVTFAGAFLASLGVFDIFLVFILGWMGDIIWDLLFYSIGRFGWHLFQKSTTVKNKKESVFIKKLDHLIQDNLALAILAIKFTPYAPPIGLTYIGKVHVDLRKYLLYSTLLCIPIPLITGLVGYHIWIMNTLLSKYSGTTLLIYILWAVIAMSSAVAFFLFLKSKSIQILKREESISDKIEKNTKSDTKSDTRA